MTWLQSNQPLRPHCTVWSKKEALTFSHCTPEKAASPSIPPRLFGFLLNSWTSHDGYTSSRCSRGRSKVGGDSPFLKGRRCVVIQVILGAKEGANQRDMDKNRDGERFKEGIGVGHLKELILKSAVCRNCTVLLL